MIYPDDFINKNICGRSEEILKHIPDNQINLTITSPPYDRLRNYKNTVGVETFDGGYTIPFREIARELFRVTKDGGIVVWVVNDQVTDGGETGTSFKMALDFMDLGFKLYDTMIYHKNGAAFPEVGRYAQVFEYMFVFLKGKKPNTVNLLKDKKNRWAGVSTFGKPSKRTKDGELKSKERFKVAEYGFRYNVWYINNGKNYTTKDDFAYDHPAMFPEQLVEDHILTWSNEGDLILDPMSGCFDKETEILTKNGWVLFKDLSNQDYVSSINNNGYLNYEKPKKIIKYHYDGDMYHFTNYHFDLLVTPDHNNYCKRRYRNEFEFVKSTDIRSQYKMKTSIKWNGKHTNTIQLNDGCYHKNNRHVSYQTKSKNEIRYCFDCEKKYTLSDNYSKNSVEYIDSEKFMKLLGLFLSDGWVSGNSIYISQKKINGIEYIKNVLKELNINHDYNNYKFRFHNMNIKNYLLKFGHMSYNKFIIDEIKELSTELLNYLLEGLIIGDGSYRKNGFRYWSTSKKLIDDVQEISIKCGYSCNLHETNHLNKKDSIINGKPIISRRNIWYITATKNRLTPKISTNNINIKYYNDMVYCVEVSDPHLLLVRRNGKVVISGNSGTSQKMSKLNNRKFIGIDKIEEYVEIANKRVDNIIPYSAERLNPKVAFIETREEIIKRRQANRKKKKENL